MSISKLSRKIAMSVIITRESLGKYELGIARVTVFRIEKNLIRLICVPRKDS